MAKTTDTTDSQMFNLVCKDRFDDIDRKLDLLLNKLLNGNGEPSMVVRVDRLEQMSKSASKSFWIAVSALTIVAVKSIWDIITGAK